MSKAESEEQEPRTTPRQDAQGTRAYEERAPDETPFAEVVDDLREQGYSWREVFNEMDAVFGAVDKAAYEESMKLIPEWRVAVRVPDPNTPSGHRYEYHERTGRDRAEVFERVERTTGYEVVEEESEQVGYGRYS